MALGTNNNQNNSGYAPNYYAKIRFKNEADKVQLSFGYWKGSLRIAISDIPVNYGSRAEELAVIFLSPMKAHILTGFVDTVIEESILNPDKNVAYGVNTGVSENQGLITVGFENGYRYIVIGKIDKNGNYIQSQRFNFNLDYNYGLIFEDVQKLIFAKQYNNNAELVLFKYILEDYVHSANGALAQSVWSVGRESENIHNIREALGIGKGNYNNNIGAGTNGSFFNNNGNKISNSSSASEGNKEFSGMNKPYTGGTIDDMEDEFDN